MPWLPSWLVWTSCLLKGPVNLEEKTVLGKPQKHGSAQTLDGFCLESGLCYVFVGGDNTFCAHVHRGNICLDSSVGLNYVKPKIFELGYFPLLLRINDVYGFWGGGG